MQQWKKACCDQDERMSHTYRRVKIKVAGASVCEKWSIFLVDERNHGDFGELGLNLLTAELDRSILSSECRSNESIGSSLGAGTDGREAQNISSRNFMGDDPQRCGCAQKRWQQKRQRTRHRLPIAELDTSCVGGPERGTPGLAVGVFTLVLLWRWFPTMSVRAPWYASHLCAHTAPEPGCETCEHFQRIAAVSEVQQSLVEELAMTMGVEESRAQEALQAVASRDINDAIDWLLAQAVSRTDVDPASEASAEVQPMTAPSQPAPPPLARAGSLECCAICLDRYTDRVTTACRHMFCRACIVSVLERQDTSDTTAGKCPYCRRDVHIEDLAAVPDGMTISAALASRPRALSWTAAHGPTHGDTQRWNDPAALGERLTGGELRLYAVRVWCGQWVNGLQAVYAPSSAGASPASRDLVLMPEHRGNHGPNEMRELVLEPGERITQVSGRVGGWMDQMSISTSREGRGGGRLIRFGTSRGGRPFQLVPPDGSHIVGFSGGHGGHLHHIKGGCLTI